MPRIKASPKKCVKTTNSQSVSNTWVVLLKGDALDAPEGTPDIIQLRHPQTGNPTMFLLNSGDGMVQEVLTFSENRSRSWFVEETVKAEGKMHLSTPIDPILLVIPYLKKSHYAVPVDILLKDDEFPETERLLQIVSLKHLNQVADKKGDDELNIYKYNEEKTLTWLHRKAERVAEVLKQKGVHVGSGAVSSTFVKSSKDEDPSQEAYLKYAHGILAEYLEEEMGAQLQQRLGLPEEKPVERDSKRKLTETQVADGNSNVPPPPAASPPESAELKKPRLDEPSQGGVLDLTKPEKTSKPTISSKEKQRAKAASGSKSISSFFKKK